MERICTGCGGRLTICRDTPNLYAEPLTPTPPTGEDDFHLTPFVCGCCGLVHWYADKPEIFDMESQTPTEPCTTENAASYI